ncbi:AraC family transcriptional regulator [Paenibacillus mucilaginosus]|uniref:AraC/XylS family transcriptional regulator n=1 Tax=Paenibacillus mucilaginosus (strain KNP414) TaxID=1036673 RepID=F8F7U9_PAEMK|nr:AraC family transcriptional regulator [Paenibacillus mucilaginosus]AEI40853.1 AraC/XylS family transcriptional regulator [Paenibacillus mucilaginosus KNP414]MCG7211680.1 AraC family transcriptional regulator [Paenibacillus mucilaginosus]WDM29963.1 helix-turn-helix transcriptional regulator [Paenibacillus mucilaginosus]
MHYFKTGIERPVEFLSCGLFVSDVPWTHANRIVDSFEIIIGVSKRLYIAQGGTRYEVKPGEVLLLPPGQIHEGYRECEEGISFYWFHFLPAGPYELLDESALSEELAHLNDPDFCRTFSQVCFPLYYTNPRIERVNILFQQLQHIASSNYYTRSAAHYLSTSLLIELSEQMISDYYSSSRMTQGDKSISEIIEWIRIHMRENISVTDVADKFAYNKNYLSRFFKKKTGYNLQEYIHLLKISKAKDLLTRSTRSIKVIAEGVGFQDEKYFMRLFKKYENMTPTEYREAYYRLHMNNH